jgi:hypothetical protein
VIRDYDDDDDDDDDNNNSNVALSKFCGVRTTLNVGSEIFIHCIAGNMLRRTEAWYVEMCTGISTGSV